MTLDFLVRGGTVVDGSGAPGFDGAIGVEGSRVVVFRGDVDGIEAGRVIDAPGRIVCPGFIDIHSHSDLALFGRATHLVKSRQGVTTELVGVDGLSYAPFTDLAALREHAEVNRGIGGDLPDEVKWSTVASYLEQVESRSTTNVACLVGNSALRQSVIGWSSRKATPGELAAMSGLLSDALDEGAFGLSTGLDYPPGGYADTAELIELATVAARAGGVYHSHIRYALGDRFLDPIGEALEIGRRSGVAVHVTHLTHRLGRDEEPERALELLHRARRDGGAATFDTLIVREGQTRLLILFPQWLHDAGPGGIRGHLSDPAARRRLRDEVRPRSPSWADTWLTNLRQPRNRDLDGASVDDIARERGDHPVDVLCDLLLEEELGVGFVFAGVDTTAIATWLDDDSAMVSSDGILAGDRPSPRTGATFPRLLELARAQGRAWPDVIRRVTALPAALLGLADRGRLADGMAADLVVFDPATVGSKADRLDPLQPPTGIDMVMVNGTLVTTNGRWTGAFPGRALRASRHG